MLCSLLFTGKAIVYNPYEPSINVASMLGFVKNQNGTLAVSNRIFETWLYNLYLSTAKMQSKEIYSASLHDKNQFVVDGHLNMRLILERYVIELKIWRGEEYNSRGEAQLVGYLDDYHLKKGYMLSFNFNKNKTIGVREIVLGDKVIVEAVV